MVSHPKSMWSFALLAIVLVFDVARAGDQTPCHIFKTYKPQCFDDQHTRPRLPAKISKWLGMDSRNTITLDAAWWTSQRSITFALEILLREKLGYDVMMYDYSDHTTCDIDQEAYYRNVLGVDADEIPSGQSTTVTQYMNLYFGKSTFNLELWNANGELGRSFVTKRITKESPAIVDLFSGMDDGLGSVARNGWFVDSTHLSDVTKFTSLSALEANGAFTVGHADEFVYSTDIPHEWSGDAVVSEKWCPNDGQTAPRLSGTIDCEYDSWHATDVQCCTRRKNAEGTCGTLQMCYAFVIGGPSWIADGLEKNEYKVLSSGLPIEVVYYGDTHNISSYATNTLEKPLMFYWWEPDLSIVPNPNIQDEAYIESDKYESTPYYYSPDKSASKLIRIRLLDITYCTSDYGDSRYLNTNSMFFTNSSSASVCDFRKDVLEKGRYKPNQLFYKDAFYLVERFRITFSSHFVLQNMTKNEALIAERDAILAANPDLENYEDSRLVALGTIPGDILQSLAACKWLKENTAIWEDFIIPDSFIFDEIKIVFYVVVCASVIVFLKACRFYTSRGYKDPLLLADQGMEVHESSPYLVGKMDPDGTVIGVEAPHPGRGATKVDFLMKYMNVATDEDYVQITVLASGSCIVYLAVKDGVPYPESVPGPFDCGIAKLDVDFLMPEASENDGFTISKVAGLKNVVKLSCQVGRNVLKLPLLKNRTYNVVRSMHLQLEPGVLYDDASSPAFDSDIPVLNLDIHEAVHFPSGTSVTDVESSQLKVVHLLNAFIKAGMRGPKVSYLMVRYQIMHFLLAITNSFIWNMTFVYFLGEGLIKLQPDWCIAMSLVFFGIFIMKSYSQLHFLDGSIELRTYLAGLVQTKYLTLTQGDVSQISDCEPLFRVTTLTDLESIQDGIWVAFNEVLKNCYEFLGYMAFIIWLWTEKDGGGMRRLPLNYVNMYLSTCFSVLGVGAVFIFVFRTKRGYNIGKNEDRLEVILFSGQHFILHFRKWVHEMKLRVDTVSNQYNKTWMHILAGFYEGWHFKFGNSTILLLAACICQCYLYLHANSWLKTFQGDEGKLGIDVYFYWVGSFAFTLMNVTNILMNTSGMLQNTSKVAHISKLLNLETTVMKRIRNTPLQYGSGDTTKQFRDHESSNISTDMEDNSALVIKDFSASYSSDDTTLTNSFKSISKKFDASFQADKSSLTDLLVTLKLFSNAKMVNPSGATTISLPRGGIIGVCKTNDGKSKVFMNLLTGADIAHAGVIGISPTLSYAEVSGLRENVLMSETLKFNLLSGMRKGLKRFPIHSPEHKEYSDRTKSYSSKMIWSLCKEIGLPHILIGSSYKPMWDEFYLDSYGEFLNEAEVIKIKFAASLLARPDVLVIDGLGDESEQPVVERFCDIIKKFLQFDLDGIDSPGAKKSKTTRTAIWCGKRETLRTVLEGKEPVLILKEKEVLISNKGAL